MRTATLGALGASIAHEVSQPLTAVLTNAEAGMRWLGRETPDLDEVRTALECILAAGRRASDIVKSIKACLDPTPPAPARLCVSELIGEAIALVQPDVAREGAAVEVDVAPGLAAVEGDRIRLQQILVNLMANAAHAMAGQRTPRLIVVHASQPEPGRVAIAVRDSGPGIAGDHLHRVFDPFFTTKPEGMGLGLAICRATAEAHGGHIVVHSVPGAGATFRLVLPACARTP